MTSLIVPGSDAYTEDGAKVEVVAVIPGEGYAVRTIYEEDDWGTHAGKVFTTQGPLFREPPRAVYEERIAKLRAVAVELSDEIETMRAVRAGFEREERDMRERVRRHGLLEQIDAALTNRITHVVIQSSWENEVRLLTLAEALKDTDSRWRLRPLILEAKQESDGVRLVWKAEQSSAEGLPFTSEADARAKAVELVEGLLVSFQRAPDAEIRRLDGVLRSATRLGVEIPTDLAERKRAYEANAAQIAVQQAKQSLALAETRLAALAKPTDEPVSVPA